MAEPDKLNSEMPTRLAEARARLRTLENKDWWRWVTVVVVTLLLTAGVFSLSLPTFVRDFREQRDLDVGVMGLLGVVLLFDLFAVYQQVVISRMRREMLNQVGMIATLELLRAPDPETVEGRSRRRRFVRFHFDKRVSITPVAGHRQVEIVGRTCDLSEGGLGVVIPESLEPGTEIRVQLSLGFEDVLVAPAIVRQRRGFHHCIEFQGITPAQVQAIRKACAGAAPVEDWIHGMQGTARQ